MISAYIGLGSNLADPIQQVRQALTQLQQLPNSQVVASSRFYRSRALGPGEQPDYINAVAHIKTALSALDLLSELQNIEQQQGRVRGPIQWQPRTLDLDLLLYGQNCIDHPRLQVPHPRLHERNFVTQPLMDVAPQLELPKGLPLVRLNEQLGSDGLDPLKCPKFIAIEGPIGAGKTTLTHRLTQTLGAKTLLEGHAENPFLTDYYRDPERWALATQLFFFTQRLQQISTVKIDRFTQAPWVADFCLLKDRLFAQLTLPPNELELYHQVNRHTQLQLPQPDCLIYLSAPTDILLQRIQQRGRDYERPISANYLQLLTDAHEHLLTTFTSCPVIRVNTAEVKLAESARDYEKLVEYILFECAGNKRTITLSPG